MGGLGRYDDWLSDGEQFPPPGRHRLTLEQTHELFVDNTAFSGSTTRAALWSNLETYLARFAAVEAEHAARLAEVGREDAGVVHGLWLAGSFVSSKVDPNNVDVTLLLDAVARQALLGRANTGWLRRAFDRDKVHADLRLWSLGVNYDPAASPFRPRDWTAGQRTYLGDRGLWDDFWQRARTAPTAPTLDTAAPVRGYVEVVL